MVPTTIFVSCKMPCLCWHLTSFVTCDNSAVTLVEKEVQSSTQDGAICELSVLADVTNEQSTKIKRKIRILDHPKNLIEVLRARLVIEKGISGNAITTGPNKYRFTRTFLDGEALRIFDLKSTELRQETVPNL